MPQVRILFTDGSRDEIDVESEESVTASVVEGRVFVMAEAPGTGEPIEVLDAPIEEVAAVVTSPWSESDGEIEMAETTIWSSSVSYEAVIRYAEKNPTHLPLLDRMWELHNANPNHTFTARLVLQPGPWRPNLTRFVTLGILVKVSGGAGSTGQVNYALADPPNFQRALRELGRLG